MAKWRMRAIMLVSFHGSFIQSIDVAFLFQALHGAKIKISFNIHAGELRHEAVSDVEGILDGLVVWDRDFIQVLGVSGSHVSAYHLEGLLSLFQNNGDAGDISPGDAVDDSRVLLGILSCRP